jgi:hypothetical protein
MSVHQKLAEKQLKYNSAEHYTLQNVRFFLWLINTYPDQSLKFIDRRDMGKPYNKYEMQLRKEWKSQK